MQQLSGILIILGFILVAFESGGAALVAWGLALALTHWM
jgi:hypothetical protein